MKFTTRVKHAVNAFNEKEKVTNSRGLATDFLRNGNKNKTMLQDWSQVEMSDQDMYTGYSYAAIKKRANRASSLGRKFLYTEASKQIQEAAKKQDIQIIHPYLQLVEKSKEFTKRKFWHDISTYLDLEGVYYLMAVRAVSNGRNGETKVGKIQKLSMLNPYMIRKVIKESDGTVGGYVESRAGLYREIPKEMIIEIRLLNPFDNEKPFSMTDAAKESQFTMKQAGDYTRHSIKGNINSPGAITTDVELDDNVFDNFVSRIQNHSKGEPLYGNGSGAINWSSMQIDLDKAALDKINEIHRSILFAVSGTSKTTLGIEESGTTRDTSQVQKDNFTEDAVMPQVEDIIDALNLDYRKWYPEWEKDEYEILLDNPLESNREAELADIEIREAELTLRESLIGMGYEYEIASKYARGDIPIDELGEPTLEEEMTDEEVEAVALREVGITKDEKDEEPEASATQGNNLVLRTATNKFVTKEFNQKKLKEAIKQAKTYKAEQKAKAKEAKEKESLKLEAQAKPENKITAEALNQISIGDYPDLYKDIDIDTKDLGCIMINTEMIPVAQYIKDGQDDVYSEGNHSGLVGEEEPHATLLFGLLENGNTWKDKVDKVLEEWELPTVTIEEVTHFELEDSNVIIGLLKKTPELIDGHERLTLLPHVSTHSEYLPHISLAYIKKDVDVDKWVKPLARKYNGQKVATKGINYGDLPEDTPKKKTKNDSTEARLSHDCSQHEHEANSTLDKAKNALEPAIQHNVALQESDLYTSAQGIQSEMANLIILAIRNGNYQKANELLTDAEARELNKKLKLLLAAYYLTLMPIYGKQLMDVRLGEYGTQGIFAMTDQIERYVDESSQAAADSHIKTIRNDLINAATEAQAKVDEDAVIQAVKWSVEARETKYLPKLPTNPNLEDITKAVKSGAFKGDQALYKRAREFSREGGGLDEMTRAIQKEYQNISKNRARTIARHETNRVFNMAQYQADLQFLQENGWLQKGYKRLRSRTGDPCPVCESLINETTANPIPFEQNFADLGATLNANYKKKDGKTAVQTIPISYEAIKAGNVHINCRCEYVLLIKQDNGTFINKLDSRIDNGGPGSGNHGHSGRPGAVGGSSSYGLNESTYKFINEVPVTITGENYRAKALFDELGYTGKPKLVDEIAKNETPLYRGIIEEDGNTFKENFIKGNFFVGDGNVGPGAYFTEDSRLAESFSGNGVLIKASLQKDAKGVGIGELKAEMKSLRDSGLTDASTNGYFDGFMFAHTEPGVFAALKGYDYIDVPSTPTYGPQTVILNRTKLNVEKSYVDVRNSASKIKNYSPSQPRDKDGKFASYGGYGSLGPSGFIDQIRADYKDTLTAEQKIEVMSYTDSSYQYTNPKLREVRGDTSKLDDYRKETVKQLDSAMIHKLKGDTELYRGVDIEGQFLKGDVINNFGYSSTSFGKDTAEKFAIDASGPKSAKVLTIKAKAGQKGLIPAIISDNDVDVSLRGQEKEYLLPRNLKLKVTDTKQRTGDVNGDKFKYTEVITEIIK